MTAPVTCAVRAGAAYFAIIFALGFALGTIRVTLIEPRLGIGPATLIELPVMLGTSWIVCGWLVRRCNVPANISARTAMGATAFTLLMLGELGISLFVFGRTTAEHFAVYREPAKQLGLAAQLLFASYPLVRLYAIPSESSA